MRKGFASSIDYALALGKWLVLSILLGAVCSLVGSAFHHLIDIAAEYREHHDFIIYLLPVGGLAVVAAYRLFKVKTSTGMNEVISTVREGEIPPHGLGPSIFAGTVLSQFVGASAGREGAALQLGAGIAATAVRMLKMNKRDAHLMLLAGMSAVFAALFGTPVAAAIFVIEFITVGEMRYSGFLPCIFASLTSYWVSTLLGVAPVRFDLAIVPAFAPLAIGQTVVVAIAAALMSIAFCVVVHSAQHFCARTVKNDFLRVAIGGAVVLGLTLLVGVRDYNGAGMNLVSAAVAGNARPEAFVMKLIFTALSIGAGFKGGEIVPAFAVGATLGCVVGSLLGLDPGFAAAMGMIALFCGVVNCPIASVVLGVEIFGGEALPFLAIVCAVSYMLSGYFGLYGTQRIVYSKLSDEYVDRIVG